MGEATNLLLQLEQGNQVAAEQLLPLVYNELRKLAAFRLAHEKPGHTLDATALVHEAYLRLVGPENSKAWNGRAHFYQAAAEAMRRILIEKARRRTTQKHGAGHRRVDLDAACSIAAESSSHDFLLLNDAIDRLAQESPAKAELVKLRYFVGLSVREAADLLGVSVATAERYWVYARSWLYAELGDNRDEGDSN